MKIINFTVNQLLNSGIHLGHKKHNINQNVYPYIYGIRNSFCIFDLEQTIFLLKRALSFITSITTNNGNFLFACVSPIKLLKRFTYFIGKQAKQQIYVNSKWEGGVLSNWSHLTISRYNLFLKNAIAQKKYLGKVEKRTYKKLLFFVNSFQLNSKKEDERKNINKIFKKKQISDKKPKLLHIPEAVFLYNPLNNEFAAKEIYKVQIPLVGIIDSNTPNIELYTYPIPGNDDSFSSYKLFLYLTANACIKGITIKRQKVWKNILLK